MSAIQRQAAVSFLLLCAFSIRSNSGTNMTSLVLSQDGQPAATILLSPVPTRSAQFAAAELQCHIRKITGATLPIVTNETAVVGTRILVGASKSTESLGLTAGAFQSQEYLIGFRTNTLILMGKDKPDTSRVNYDNFRSFPDLFDEQGTCYAVYGFLERCCDVRWYLPTDLGLVCPSNRTLQVAGVDIRRSPVMKHRAEYCLPIPQDLCGDTIRGSMPRPALAEREHALWWRRNRIGGEKYACSHSLNGYYARFLLTNNPAVFEGEHREYFAQGYPDKPPQMCYSNRGLINQVVQDANAYFAGKGVKTGAAAAGDYFGVAPMDTSEWCKCPDCAGKMLPTSVRAKGLYSNDTTSDYIFHFVNQIAGQVYKTHPDKFISALAYHDYAYPPSREKLAPNVSIQLCLHARAVSSKPMQDNDLKILDLWVNESKDRRKFLWLYYCFPSLSAVSGQWRCFPGFFGHHVVKQMAVWHKAGIRGIFYEPSYLADAASQQRSVLFDQVESYVTWKLADDPTLDGNQLIEEFFTRYYGAAAQPMKAFYNQVEEIYCNPTNYPSGAGGQTEEIAWGKLGTAERMKELGGLMEQAKSAAVTDMEKKRVELFEKGVWDYMVKGRERYLEKNDPETVKQKSAYHDKIKSSPPPSATIPAVTAGAGGDPLKVDWTKARVLGKWSTVTGYPMDHKISVRVAHDQQYLYVQLEEVTDPAKLFDAGLWDGNNWEIFIAREKGKLPYYQFAVSPAGKQTALVYETAVKKDGKEWDSGVKVLSDTKSSDRWTVFLAIPMAKLAPEGIKAGQKIYSNFFRTALSDSCGVELLAWSPNFEENFHNLDRMGELIFE